MSTRQLINQIKLQYSNNKTNSIPIYSEDFVFDKKCYNPKRLSQWLSQKEFNIIIAELNKIVTKSFIKKNKGEQIKVYNFIYFILAVIVLFFILASFSLFKAKDAKDSDSTDPDDLNLAYVIGIVLFCLMLIMILGLSWYNFKHITYQMITLENTIHNYIKQYIGFLNVYFQGVLKWVYHQSIVMIEIIIVNSDDEDISSSSSLVFNRNALLRKDKDYIEEVLELFEEEDDDIGKEIDSRLYRRKEKEESMQQYQPVKQTNDETSSINVKESFELTRANLRKVIEKSKQKRRMLFDIHNDKEKAMIRKSHSK